MVQRTRAGRTVEGVARRAPPRLRRRPPRRTPPRPPRAEPLFWTALQCKEGRVAETAGGASEPRSP